MVWCAVIIRLSGGVVFIINGHYVRILMCVCVTTK